MSEADLAFQWAGFKICQKKKYCKGVEGPAPGKFLICKDFLVYCKAYWALFLTQYITKS